MRIAVLAVAVVVSSCSTAPWRLVPPPYTAASFDGAEDARLRFADGIELVMAAPRVANGSETPVLEGTVAGDMWRVPLAEVVGLETRRTEPLRVVANALIATAVVAGVVAICVCTGANPPLDGLSFTGPKEEPPEDEARGVGRAAEAR